MKYWKRLIGLCGMIFMIMMGVSCKTGPYSPKAEDVINVTMSKYSISPGETSTIIIYGRRGNGLSMPDGVVVRLSVDKGYILNIKNGNEEPIDCVRLVKGTASATYKPDPNFAGGAAILSIACGEAKVIPPQVSIYIQSNTATQLFLSAEPVLLPPPGGETTITAGVFSKDMKPVPEQKVWFNTTAGRFLSGSPIETDCLGKAVIRLHTASEATVTASLNDLKKEIKIQVQEPPKPNFTFSPTNPIGTETIYFNAAESRIIDSTYNMFEWRFGDGSALSFGEMVEHQYSVSSEKTFVVTLTATSSEGYKGIVSKEITVRPMEAVFTWFPVPPKVKQPVTFDATNSQGNIRWYRWEFGDGGTKETDVPTYMYSGYKSAGFYDVTLTILGVHGEKATSTMRIKVVE